MITLLESHFRPTANIGTPIGVPKAIAREWLMAILPRLWGICYKNFDRLRIYSLCQSICRYLTSIGNKIYRPFNALYIKYWGCERNVIEEPWKPQHSIEFNGDLALQQLLLKNRSIDPYSLAFSRLKVNIPLD